MIPGSSYSVRLRIAAAVGALGERSVVPRLVELLGDEQVNRDVRGSIADAVGALGGTEDAARSLAERLAKTDNLEIRQGFYDVLYQVSRQAGVRVLQDGSVVPLGGSTGP